MKKRNTNGTHVSHLTILSKNIEISGWTRVPPQLFEARWIKISYLRTITFSSFCLWEFLRFFWNNLYRCCRVAEAIATWEVNFTKQIILNHMKATNIQLKQYKLAAMEWVTIYLFSSYSAELKIRTIKKKLLCYCCKSVLWK